MHTHTHIHAHTHTHAHTHAHAHMFCGPQLIISAIAMMESKLIYYTRARTHTLCFLADFTGQYFIQTTVLITICNSLLCQIRIITSMRKTSHNHQHVPIFAVHQHHP